MFPRSIYDNATTRAVPRAFGQARVAPHNNGSITLSISASGLRRNTNYTVFIDGDGVTWNRPATANNFTQIRTIRTNSVGSTGGWREIFIPRGTFGAGWHRWSVFLNDANAGRSVLVSDNLHFNLRNR
jgi:hypothetical protein